jgi:hypothetical protein
MTRQRSLDNFPYTFDTEKLLAMREIKHHDPARMTPEQRRAQVAQLLAAGLIRLREHNAIAAPESGAVALGFYGDQRVHANPNDTDVQEVA